MPSLRAGVSPPKSPLLNMNVQLQQTAKALDDHVTLSTTKKQQQKKKKKKKKKTAAVAAETSALLLTDTHRPDIMSSDN